MKWFFFILTLAFLFLSNFAQAMQDMPALDVKISAHGKEYLESNFQNLLKKQSIDFNKFQIQDLIGKTKVLDLDELSIDEETKALIETLKEKLGELFVGLDLNQQHQILYALKDIQVDLAWDRLGINIDSPLDYDIKEEGIILNLNVRIPNLKLAVREARAQDLKNPIFGEFQLLDLLLTPTKESLPLTLSMPVFVKVLAGRLDFKIIQIESNFSDLVIHADFSDIILPEIELHINGKTYPLNDQYIKELISYNSSALLAEIQELAQTYLKNSGPQLIENALVKNVNFDLSNLTPIELPLSPANDLRGPLQWNLTWQHLYLEDQSLYFGLFGGLEDSTTGPIPLGISEFAVDFDQNYPNLGLDHDFTLGLNKGLLNQILTASYERGHLKSIQQGKTTIKMAQTPIIDIKMIRGKLVPVLKVALYHTVKGIGSFAVKNPIKLYADIILNLKVNPRGKIQLQFVDIDDDSLHIPKQYIRFLKGTVRDMAKKQANQLSSSLRGKILVDDFDLPREILGIPFAAKKVYLTPKGFIRLGVDFE